MDEEKEISPVVITKPSIYDFLKNRFFKDTVPQKVSLIGEWELYEVEATPVNRLTICSILLKEYPPFGKGPEGEHVIVTRDYYLVITPPKLGVTNDTFKFAIRKRNFALCFETDMSEEEDYDRNKVKPKLRYVYQARFTLPEQYPGLSEKLKEIHASMEHYEADNVAWLFISKLQTNNFDVIPQFRNVFKPNQSCVFEEGFCARFESGYIVIESDRSITFVVDYDAATGIYPLLEKFVSGDLATLDTIIEKLKVAYLNVEVDGYLPIPDKTLETILISAIGYSI